MKNKLITATAIILTSLSLVGCVPAVVAGTGATAYYVGKDSRPAGTIVDDAAITTAIKAKLLADKLTSAVDIHVDTARGIVTLSGNVPSYASYQRAIALAKEAKGVKKVISKLTIIH